jgi:hypothetical protein
LEAVPVNGKPFSGIYISDFVDSSFGPYREVLFATFCKPLNADSKEAGFLFTHAYNSTKKAIGLWNIHWAIIYQLATIRYGETENELSAGLNLDGENLVEIKMDKSDHFIEDNREFSDHFGFCGTRYNFSKYRISLKMNCRRKYFTPQRDQFHIADIHPLADVLKQLRFKPFMWEQHRNTEVSIFAPTQDAISPRSQDIRPVDS